MNNTSFIFRIFFLASLLPIVIGTCVLLFLIAPGISQAQNPIPAKPQSKSILLVNGIAHIGNGRVVENSVIGFKDGKISLVADATLIKLQQGAFDTLINIQGKHVYPGFIALNTTIGLSEIELVRATNDYREVGGLNPSARAIIAYNTDSKVIPTVRSNGILLAEIVPQGGLISGQSSLVELDAWNWEDAAYKTDIGIHLNWPGMTTFKYPGAPTEEEQKKNNEKALADVKSLFEDARAYYQSKTTTEKNLSLDAMKGLFDGTRKLFIHANNIKQIIASVNFCKGFGIKMVLVDGNDSWMVTDLLKENNIPVVIGRTHSLPSRQDEDVYLPYKLPKLLKDAGVKFCFSNDGFWQVRNLPFNAGTGSAYGLTKEEAIEAATKSAAEIAGIEKTLGTLEEGKDATFIISSGDVLDMKSSNIETAFIRGKNLDLDDIQKQLYRKYSAKYGLE